MIDLDRWLSEELGIELGPRPWLSVQRSGPVYRLVDHPTREAAVADCLSWSFRSRAVVDRERGRFFPVGADVAPEPFDAAWFVAWFRLDPDLAETAITRERQRAPREWSLDGTVL